MGLRQAKVCAGGTTGVRHLGHIYPSTSYPNSGLDLKVTSG